MSRYLILPIFLTVLFLLSSKIAEATPVINSNYNGGNGAPTSNAFTASYTSNPNNNDLGLLGANCTSTMAVPTGWSSVYGGTTGTHVGTSNYFAIFSKVLVGSSDLNTTVTCNGTKYSYTILDLLSAGTPSVGTLVTATSATATGSVTYTVPSAGGLIVEFYEAYTASGSAATGITDSASVSTTAAANSGNPGVNAEIMYTFYSGADPYSGVTQPYTNAGTWNHSNATLGSVDVFILPGNSVHSTMLLPFPFSIYGIAI